MENEEQGQDGRGGVVVEIDHGAGSGSAGAAPEESGGFLCRKILCVPSGKRSSRANGERLPRSASQMRSWSSSKVMRAYSSPVSSSSGLTYSWPLRPVPLIEYSVTISTARPARASTILREDDLSDITGRAGAT